ncbi:MULTISPECIES: CHAD domain-containing protein [Metallosphaera]|uniref:CHAD domain-containing protein n=1 Tax=Metallosphaera TaxID=41980 RepID=UPI001CEF0B26|nr:MULTISPECIES: CHAD domain-containing protein [Metallosphaera]MCY0861400.1 CHAD domain-containing protein [Metallosphaera prunae]WPX07172.1 CHAD domain-containing protein [Metallosphaera sedula DSM 5348]
MLPLLGTELRRPEDYANEKLEEFKKLFGTSPNQVHDARVELRKYAVVVEALYPLHMDFDLLDNSRGILKLLGKVRDYDVHGCPRVDREEVLRRVSARLPRLRRLPRLYGSRFLVAENLMRIYGDIPFVNDFHGVRKLLRRARFLAESLGIFNDSLKELVKTMGNERDRMAQEACQGKIPVLNLDVSRIKEIGRMEVREILLSDHEFRHIKQKLSQF